MAEQKPQREKPAAPKKPLVERLRDFAEGFLGELEALLNPPRPVRVPVGGRRPR